MKNHNQLQHQHNEPPKQAVAEYAGTIATRLLNTEIIDDTSSMRAAERDQAAEYWREKASDPNADTATRAEAVQQAIDVQREADNYAGVNDPSIRPEGYQPYSDEAIAASRAKVEAIHRVS